MRYLSWDVLLFPQEGNDVKTPLQEFKTRCDVVQDSGSDVVLHTSTTTYYNAVTRGLPTVSCYIPSLPCKNLFRVSLHCWAPPEATKATMSLESKDDIVVFEAKVLIDGECVADLVFGADAHWPQIIDTTAPPKDGKPGPLRFPGFHPEMLSQTWVLPHESMGRIKVLIAEGVSHGPPSSTSFEKIRNLVAFSFLHTPLHILEDSGIAWPNPGMFYQMSYPDSNPLSPRKAKSADPDTHAHSPRRGTLANAIGAPANLDSTIAPQSLSNGIFHPGMGMLPPPFKAHRHQAGDPFLSQYHYHDSFSGVGGPLSQRNPFQGDTRHTSSSGDISMKDAPSRSTTSNEVMADYIRPLSPYNRLHSSSLNHSSRSFSPEGYRTLSLLAPSTMRSRSPPHDRHVSAESLRGPRMQRFFDDFDVQSERETQLPEQSQFTEMIDAMSPRKVPESAHYQPTTSRASSATNTPTASTRPSAAAEARASSYHGKNPSMPQSSFELPKPNTIQIPSKSASKSQSRTHRNEFCQPGSVDKTPYDAKKIVRVSPSTNIKSRKEKRNDELGHSDAKKSQEVASAGPSSIQDEEKAEVTHPSSGSNKRRRVTSNNSLGATLAAQEKTTRLVPEESSNHDIQPDSPEKTNEIDDLTAEGIITRAPLGNLSNKA